MDKPAVTEHPIHDLLSRRWSPRAFADQPVEPAKLRSLFEAARWAASAYNEQPWSFLVAIREDPAGFERALACLADANQVWAKFAPVLVFTTIQTRFSRGDKPNRVALHDLGLAMGNLSVQAAAMGLFVHSMSGVHLDQVRQTYQIPAEHEPATAFAVGYPGDANALPQPLRDAERQPRSRKPFHQFVFADRFGQPSQLFQ